jgi:transposase
VAVGTAIPRYPDEHGQTINQPSETWIKDDERRATETERIDAVPGFEVLPRRWVVERTFGWMIRWRRLVRDFEQRLDVSEAMIHVAMGSLHLRRIAHQ